ncbi:MAG: isoprenylcysteine carboxylmethyltransferase family protein [Planctomycetota bacterium]
MTPEIAPPVRPQGKRALPGRFWYRFRGLVLLPIVLFAALFPLGEFENHLVVLPIGAVLFLCGLSVRIWAQMHLRYRLKVHKVLTTTGPYAYVRNPVYIGTSIMFVALAFLSELVWLVPVMLAWCMVLYSRVVRYEEAKLLRKYGGAYEEYLAAVPRWVPCRRSTAVDPVANARATGFLFPSVLTELYNLLLLIPFVLKELIIT